jgi:hypothetical protein
MEKTMMLYPMMFCSTFDLLRGITIGYLLHASCFIGDVTLPQKKQ